MAKLDKGLKVILDKYGIEYTDKDKLWDCRGTLVLYHKAYEIIAAQENIIFEPPQIVEADASKKTATIVVTGKMGERSEWSFGEATPNNSNNAYPFAMAEKRAKDRVIAKLVGLAQYVYSEEEAESFKEAKSQPQGYQKNIQEVPLDEKGMQELAEIERQEMSGVTREEFDFCVNRVRECFDMDALNDLANVRAHTFSKEEMNDILKDREIRDRMDKIQENKLREEIVNRKAYFEGDKK